MKVKLLFLDVDGVVRPITSKPEGPTIKFPSDNPGASYEFPVAVIENLSRIIASTNAEIVLSSTWRRSDATMSVLLDAFHEYAQTHGGPLGDITVFARMTPREKKTTRKWEVVEYVLDAIAAGEEIESWVALDDDASFLRGKKYEEEVKGHFLICNPSKGITADIADQAIDILNNNV